MSIALFSKRHLQSGVSNAIKSLFANNEQGAWYDPSDLTDEKLTFRRNLFTNSEGAIAQFNTASNVSAAVVSIPGFDSSVQFGDNSVQRDLFKQYTAVVGNVYNFQLLVVMDDGGVPVFGTDFSLYVSGSSIITPNSVTITPHPVVTNGYVISRRQIAGDVGGATGIRKSIAHSPRTFRVSAFQVELGVFTPYQKITDYYTEFMRAFPNHTLFQDSAGTTPVTAVGQPVGLMLDKRLGLVLGPDLVVNGGFSTDTAWVKGGGWTISGGRAAVDGTAAGVTYLTGVALPTVSGKSYLVSFDYSVTAGRIRLNPVLGVTTALLGAGTSGTFRSVLVADGASTLSAQAVDAETIGWVDNISIRELPGNHATQPTVISRPVMQARVNLLTKTEDFSDAVWVKQGCTVSTSSVPAPDGSLTATRIVSTADPGTSAVRVIQTIPITGSVGHIYARAGSYPYIRISKSSSSNASSAVLINLATGTYTRNNVAVSPEPVQVDDAGNGWWKIAVPFNVATANTGLIMYMTDYIGNADVGAGISAGNPPIGAFVDIWHPELKSIDMQAMRYQRVNTATDYDAIGFPKYLAFNGTNSWMSTATIDFAATDKMTLAAGVRKLSDVTTGMVVELSANAVSNNGAFAFLAPGGTGQTSALAYLRGSAATSVAGSFSAVAPLTYIQSSLFDLRGATPQLQTRQRINNTPYTGAVDVGASNFGSYPFYIGARTGTGLFFNGNLYGLVVRGALSFAPQIIALEKYTAIKTGITL